MWQARDSLWSKFKLQPTGVDCTFSGKSGAYLAMIFTCPGYCWFCTHILHCDAFSAEHIPFSQILRVANLNCSSPCPSSAENAHGKDGYRESKSGVTGCGMVKDRCTCKKTLRTQILSPRVYLSCETCVPSFSLFLFPVQRGAGNQ